MSEWVKTVSADREERKVESLSGCDALHTVARMMADAGVGFGTYGKDIRFHIHGMFAIHVYEEPEGSNLLTVEDAYRKVVKCGLTAEKAAEQVIGSDKDARRRYKWREGKVDT